MSDIQSINTSTGVPSQPTPVAVLADSSNQPSSSHPAIERAVAASQVSIEESQKKNKESAAASLKEPVNMPSYTVHYQVNGKQISVSIVDQEGRLVKTVPSSEMLKALSRANLSPRVNLHG